MTKRKKIKVLPRVRQEAVELYEGTDSTYKEIASSLGIKPTTLGSILTSQDVVRRKVKGATNFKDTDPQLKNSWGKGFYHMNLKIKGG
jgi:hypothetical protein|tara:strand:- start:1478 stop:1741 length:264 start_codon:yes stop_codon:yes gene_type:complete